MTRNTTTSFEGRVKYAIQALYRQENSRARDDCYEMYDGEYVVAAIMREAETKPALQAAIMLGWNIDTWADHEWHETANKLQDIATEDLPAHAREHRAQQRVQFRKWMDEQKAPRTELTDAGEQTVIPGCERDDPQAGAKQLDLF